MSMFIQTQTTPNPNSVKFLPGVAVLKSGTATFKFGDDLTRSPLAEALFKIGNIEDVFFSGEFVTVTKNADKEWDALRPFIFAVILDHFNNDRPVIIDHHNDDEKETSITEDPIITQIKAVIDENVRPAVAEDGGDIVFLDFKDGIVYVELRGACSGCPSAAITLKSGVENMLRYYVPEVERVEQV